MSRKDFVALANALNDMRPVASARGRVSPTAHLQWIRDCKSVAHACACSNNRFDRDRFLSACGFTVKDLSL